MYIQPFDHSCIKYVAIATVAKPSSWLNLIIQYNCMQMSYVPSCLRLNFYILTYTSIVLSIICVMCTKSSYVITYVAVAYGYTYSYVANVGSKFKSI